MANYKKKEAKDWAEENFKGIENVLMPSFKQMEVTEVISGLNIPKIAIKAVSSLFPSGITYGLDEAGVKHDIEMCIAHGFFSTTVSLEFIALPNYELIIRPFYRMVKETSKGRILLDAYICNASMDETLNNVRVAEEEGMDCIMLALPPFFYPKNENDIYDYVKTVCDSTNLGVIFYPSHKYNFERFHPSRFSPELVNRIADIPNVIAMKLGVADLAHNIECMNLCGHKVMLNSPVISWWPLFIGEFGMKWAGSAPYEYLQTVEDRRLVKHFDLLLEGKKEEAMNLYWEMTPARNTFEKFVMPMVAEGNYNLMHWKYLGWLTGMNGGPVPLATGRLYEHQKKEYKEGLLNSGMTPKEPDEAFYIGSVNYQ